MSNKSTVLYVDQALSFGGSIIVLGCLVEAIDKKTIRPVVVGEMDRSLLKYHMQGQAKIYVIKRWFNYAQWERVSAKLRNIRPRFLFKAIIYALSAVRTVANMPYILRLIIVLLTEKVDLVHVNNGMSNLEPVLAAMFLRRKFVVHFHGIETPGLFQRLLLNKVHKFIVISEFLKTELVNNGFPDENMVVIPNPVQESHALSAATDNLREKYGLKNNDKVFAIVGRIVRWKGHIEFLNAAFIVLGQVPDAKALIVGDFSDGEAAYQQKIESMIDESGYADRIIMTGYIKNVSEVYAIMDVCVHTSIEPEPFGLVIIEAMINGVPVIASNVGAPKEIVEDKVNGYIIDPSQPDALAEKTICLLRDSMLRENIGKKSRAHAKKNFNVKTYSQSVSLVYQAVLE